jgi:single-stranded DNA-binding protein
MNLNDVKIAGNLVQEPELHYTPQGTPVTNVSLGVNETYTLNNEKRTATTFVDVQLWGAAAENFAKLVQKGQQILVEGALRQDTWEDKLPIRIGPSSSSRPSAGSSSSTNLSRPGEKPLGFRNRDRKDEIFHSRCDRRSQLVREYEAAQHADGRGTILGSWSKREGGGPQLL